MANPEELRLKSLAERDFWDLCFWSEGTKKLALRNFLALNKDGYIFSGRYGIGVHRRMQNPRLAADAKASCVYSVRTGRFSDGLICVAKAICFALINDIGTVYLENSPNTRSIFPSVSEFCSYGVRVVISPPSATEAIIVRGRFYGLRIPRASRLGLPTLYAIINSFGQHTGLPIDVQPFPEGTLTLHVRSGDIFSKPRPNPGYGQPPYSYYQFCIEDSSPAFVLLVCEDDLNPVIAKIIEYCQARSIHITRQSDSLKNDISAILRSRSLAIGSGTFVPGVLSLSRNARSVYAYQYSNCPLITDSGALRVIRVLDSRADYYECIMNGNWANSILQRQLMTDYPMSGLSAGEL